MKTTHKAAYNYAMGLKMQRTYEWQVHQGLLMLNPDNQVFGLADAVEGPYTDLILELLGPTLFEWLMWWIYETDYGTQNMEFTVDGTTYNPQDMTLYRFLELVDENP